MNTMIQEIKERIIERILIEKRLINNIRIKILPTGGWQNTITMAYDLIVSRLLLKHTKILVVLEDRNSMVKRWRELGYTCLQVNDGDF